jgi:hypothetical protein
MAIRGFKKFIPHRIAVICPLTRSSARLPLPLSSFQHWSCHPDHSFLDVFSSSSGDIGIGLSPRSVLNVCGQTSSLKKQAISFSMYDLLLYDTVMVCGPYYSNAKATGQQHTLAIGWSGVTIGGIYREHLAPYQLHHEVNPSVGRSAAQSSW